MEKITDERITDDDEKQYLTRWAGHPPDSDTWEPRSSFVNAPAVLVRWQLRRHLSAIFSKLVVHHVATYDADPRAYLDELAGLLHEIEELEEVMEEVQEAIEATKAALPTLPVREQVNHLAHHGRARVNQHDVNRANRCINRKYEGKKGMQTSADVYWVRF